jgi:two-component system chemotaxis response regulator CheY
MATVLVVDDSKIMRVNVKRMLEKLGHEVVGEAENGHQSIGKYEETTPDFVTMDITMPEVNGIKDGIDAVEEIKKINSKAKIIMVTSHGEQDKVIRAIKNGASGYLLKPIKEDELKSKIEKLKL